MSSPLLHPPCFCSSYHLSFPRSAAGFSARLLRHAGCHQASFLFRKCRGEHRGYDSKNIRCMTYSSKIANIKDSDSTTLEMLIKEPHKYFDQVNISVRSGDGGHGAVLCLPVQRASSKSKGKYDQDISKKGSFNRDSNGSLILPMGGHGGDVFLYADESTETLLEFHKKKRYNAKRGGNVDAMGMLTSVLHDGFVAPSLRIPVPVGTVVKRKKGKFMADLARPGDEILVARGGQGGWGQNLELLYERVLRYPDRVRNLYFTFLFVLRAATKAADYLEQAEYSTGNPDEDLKTQSLVRLLVYNPELQAACPVPYDEAKLWQGESSPELKQQIQKQFRNISALMDCVGCEKCRLWGKLQVLGLGTALKILFSVNGQNHLNQPLQLQRNEVIALVNLLNRLSESVNFVREMGPSAENIMERRPSSPARKTPL